MVVGEADGRLIAYDFAGNGGDLKDQGIGDHIGCCEGGIRVQGLGWVVAMLLMGCGSLWCRASALGIGTATRS